MSEWRTVPFGSLCDITRGASPRPIHDFISDRGVPWVKISDATSDNSRFLSSTKQRIKVDGVSASVQVFPGDLILSNSATPGLPKFLRIEACIHDGWMLLRNFRDLDKDFAYWLLLSERLKLVALGNGSVFTNLKTDILRHHLVLLPPIHEQKAIAHILGSLDDKIDQLRKTNTVLEDMASALFKSWFVDFDPVKAKHENRPTGLPKDLDDLFPDSFEDSALGPIPKGWRVGRIDAFTDVFIGKTPPRKESHWFTENSTEMRWISIRDLGRSSTYVIESSEYLTYEAVEKFRVRRIPDNTVVLSFKMTVGRVAITVGEMTSNEAIAHFNIKDSVVISPEYLYCYLAQYDYSQLGSTSSIATAVNSDSIRSINVLVPDEQPMTIFMRQTKHLFNRVMSNIHQIRTLTNLRDTLLPKLISGDLRVPDAEQMVAELGL